MKKIESNNMIVKSNQLIETQYRLTATEQKIVYMVSSLIKKDDLDFKVYTIRISDLISLMNTKCKSEYAEIKKITAQLKKKTFTIYDTRKNSDLQINWFSSIEYFNGAGIVEFEFSPKLKPYLLQLKNHFTKFDIEEVMQLKSAYSLRIHELLRQYIQGGIKERKFTIEDLRKKLGISDDEYKFYADFKRKVILQAQKEINKKTDLSFDFLEIKNSRKVEAIKFIISSKTALSLPKESESPNSSQIPISQEICNMFDLSIYDNELFKKTKKFLLDTLSMMYLHKSHSDTIQTLLNYGDYCRILDQALAMYHEYASSGTDIKSPTSCLAHFIKEVLNSVSSNKKSLKD